MQITWIFFEGCLLVHISTNECIQTMLTILIGTSELSGQLKGTANTSTWIGWKWTAYTECASFHRAAIAGACSQGRPGHPRLCRQWTSSTSYLMAKRWSFNRYEVCANIRAYLYMRSGYDLSCLLIIWKLISSPLLHILLGEAPWMTYILLSSPYYIYLYH